MKNYYMFFKYALKHMTEQWDDDTKKLFGKPKISIRENLMEGLSNCHIFEIKESLKDLLLATNPPKNFDMIRLPFPYIFLDVGITKEEAKNFGLDMKYNKITGILIQKTEAEQFSNEKECEVKNVIYAVYFNEGNGRVGFDRIPLITEDDLIIHKSAYKLVSKKDVGIVSDLALNILSFINTPDVELITKKSDEERNKKRLKKGKSPLPPKTFIKITGKTKEYLEKMENMDSWHYSHRFWVRGHWRILRNKEYWGDDVGKPIWVHEFTKGDGILIEKKYKVASPDEEEN